MASFSLSPRLCTVIGTLAPEAIAQCTASHESALTDEEICRRLQAEFDRENEEKVARTTWQCPLCRDDFSSFDGSIELDCAHRFCKECACIYLTSKVRENRSAPSELVCPMPDCSTEITVAQVQGVLHGSSAMEQFLDQRVETWDLHGDSLVMCPSANCGERFLAQTSLKKVICPHCSCCFDPRASRGHPVEIDKDFEDFIARERLQRCPRCRAVCERSQGCNYMSCRCRTNFCYLCGDALSRSDHLTHFPHGAYQNCCLNVDKREDGNMPVTSFSFRSLADVRQDFGDLVAWIQSSPGTR